MGRPFPGRAGMILLSISKLKEPIHNEYDSTLFYFGANALLQHVGWFGGSRGISKIWQTDDSAAQDQGIIAKTGIVTENGISWNA